MNPVLSLRALVFAVLATPLLAFAQSQADPDQTTPTTPATAALDGTDSAAVDALVAETSGLAPDILALQQRWGEIKYQLPKGQRVAAFEQLATQAHGVVAAHPGSAEALIWEGIILSTWAGERGGMGALGIAKRARAALEAAVKIDRRALHGSALTSLGSLYHGVPGWPISFGDDEKAEELLHQGVALSPEGIDSNYFLGQYLYDEGRYQEALRSFRKAQAAAPRPGREVADEGRQAELRKAIADAEAKLQS